MTQPYTETGTIAGYFEDSSKATQAVEALREAGFTSAHMGMVHRDHTSSSARTSTSEKTSSTWDSIKSFFSGNEAEPYADEKTQGELATREITQNPGDQKTSYDNEYGSQYDPSDLHHTLHGLSVPEDRSRYFGHRFNSSENGAVVTVNARDRVAEAEAILTRFGADLGSNASEFDYSETAEPQGVQRNIQLLGEVLRVHKDRISRGEVRLRKEIITETQTIEVPVTREELVIERHAVNQNTPTADSIGASDEIRIPLSEERAFTDKSTFVREEVAIAKKPVEEVRSLTGDVRHEELVVEDSTKRSA
jgi:uncharacterized protein (TIGR02271 family)